ncbi:MAG: hypothetical protein JSW42_08850, partial [Chloroflexota bacterium]
MHKKKGLSQKYGAAPFCARGRYDSIGGMKRKQSKAIFKPYTQNQMMLPTNLNELIPEKHLVRVVNEVIDEMDLEPLLKQY